MEKWTAKEVKEKGRYLLETQVKWFNNEITKDEYEQKMKEFFKTNIIDTKQSDEEIQKDIETRKNNLAKIDEYIIMANILKDLANRISKAQKQLTNDNMTILRILDLVITSETRIEGHIEYNKLLDAIPKEARAKISKELAKPKDIDKDINELVSIEFLVGHFSKSFIPLFDSPTMQYAIIDFCLFISDFILLYYGVKTTLTMETGEGNETYKDAIEHISKVFKFSEREPKFKKTQVYYTMEKYQNLFDVRDSAEYKEAKTKFVKTLDKMIKEQKTADEMLQECIKELYKQGWWFNDKNKKK